MQCNALCNAILCNSMQCFAMRNAVQFNATLVKIYLTLHFLITVINASAAVTLLEQRPEKIFRL